MKATKAYKSKLLNPKEVVRIDVFVHPEPQALTDIREALCMGLKPNGFIFANDIVVVTFDREEA